MQRLEVSDAVRPIYGSLGVKRLKSVTRSTCTYGQIEINLQLRCLNSNFSSVEKCRISSCKTTQIARS